MQQMSIQMPMFLNSDKMQSATTIGKLFGLILVVAVMLYYYHMDLYRQLEGDPHKHHSKIEEFSVVEESDKKPYPNSYYQAFCALDR